MRVLGFSKKWDKLKQPQFTTFRLPRKDADKGRDWAVGETVQIVYKPRSPQREVLGMATIISKDTRWLARITFGEAVADGFDSYIDMVKWFTEVHGTSIGQHPLNKLTLRKLPESG